MEVRNCFFFLCSVLYFSSCSVDYDPEIKTVNECIIVNACLQPDSLITVRLYANMTEDGKSKVLPLNGAHVLLKESESVLYNDLIDSLLCLNVYPKSGEVYSIEVLHPDFPDITAETRIPLPIYCKVSPEEKLFNLSDFDFSESDVPLWITTTALFSDRPPLQYGELYTNNLLVDNVNRNEGGFIMHDKVGSGYHDSFIRIKGKHLLELTNLLYYPMLSFSIIWDTFSGIEIRLIAASKEYDQYCKTYYELMSTPSGGDLSSILYQPVSVYSNIKGGLGIFAGKSEVVYFIEE